MEDGSILTKPNSQLKLLSAMFSCVRIAVVFLFPWDHCFLGSGEFYDYLKEGSQGISSKLGRGG